MKFIRPNDSIEFDPTDIKIFLAGPISYTYDWQSEFANKLESFLLSKKKMDLDKNSEIWEPYEIDRAYSRLEQVKRLLDKITIFSPRWNPERKMEFNFDTQFNWETERLEFADIIVFGFTNYTETPSVDRSYARTTRIEFGEALARANFREWGHIHVGFGGTISKEPRNRQYIFTILSDFKDGDEYIRAKLKRYRYPVYTDWNKLIEDVVLCMRLRLL